MINCTSCTGASVETKTPAVYDADVLGAPFKIYLRDAVKLEVCSGCGAVLNTAIPDPEGLFYAISFARAFHPRKLSGEEIRFLRNVMGWTGKKLARTLGITAEHLSRCEHGRPMSETTEMLFRLYAVLQPGNPAGMADDPDADTKAKASVKRVADSIVEHLKHFKIEAGWDASEPFEFHFTRRKLDEATWPCPDGGGGEWESEHQERDAA